MSAEKTLQCRQGQLHPRGRTVKKLGSPGILAEMPQVCRVNLHKNFVFSPRLNAVFLFLPLLSRVFFTSNLYKYGCIDDIDNWLNG